MNIYVVLFLIFISLPAVALLILTYLPSKTVGEIEKRLTGGDSGEKTHNQEN